MSDCRLFSYIVTSLVFLHSSFSCKLLFFGWQVAAAFVNAHRLQSYFRGKRLKINFGVRRRNENKWSWEREIYVGPWFVIVCLVSYQRAVRCLTLDDGQ